jgi:anaerobic dimethyl sulfoxide reductase subunit B (iron-sulfur subunit)
MRCFHCERPACAEACPENGIARQPDGRVTIDDELCTGCGECVSACPYGAIVTMPDGKSAKCDQCHDEVERGWGPTCVRACPMRALRLEAGAAEAPPGRTPDPGFDEHGMGPSVLFLRRR